MHTWPGSEWEGRLSLCWEPGKMPGAERAGQGEGLWRANLESRKDWSRGRHGAGQVLRSTGLQIRGRKVQLMGRAVQSGRRKLNVVEIK